MVLVRRLVFLLLMAACGSVIAAQPAGDVQGSCRGDFNQDGRADYALLLKDVNEQTVVALIKVDGGMDAWVVHHAPLGKPLQLRCEYGRELVETTDGIRQGRRVNINGDYVALRDDNVPAIAFYFQSGEFRNLWLRPE